MDTKKSKKLLVFVPRFFKRSSLMLGLLVAITAIIATTGVAVYLYAESGVSKLDLSRPGYKDVIEKIDKNRREKETFSNTGPVNSEALEEFIQKYDIEMKSLDAAGNFEDTAVNNQQLGLPKIDDDNE